MTNPSPSPHLQTLIDALVAAAMQDAVDPTPETDTPSDTDNLAAAERALSEAIGALEQDALNGVYADIRAERERQDAQWGGPEHDDTHDAMDWQSFRQHRERRIIYERENGKPRIRLARIALVEIAALTVAQIESLDRRAAALPPESPER